MKYVRLARLSTLLLAASIPCMAQTHTNAPDTQLDRLDPALDQLVAPGTPIELVATGFTFTEGPMWHHGRLWFSDEEGGHTVAVTPEGEVSILLDWTKPPLAPPNGGKIGPNAMAVGPDGAIALCEQYGRAMQKLVGSPEDNTLHPVDFLTTWEGKQLNSPNDLVYLPDGSLVFTDPPYGLKGRNDDPAKQIPFNAVFRYKDGQLTPIITDLQLPNGVALSPDNKTLYVDNSGPDQRVIAYPLHPDGTVGTPHDVITFTGHEGPGVPDGLKVDAQGNIWTTGPGGIRIITPQGKVLGHIRLPLVANNLAWGEDGHALYICAHAHIYRVRTKVAGHLPLFQQP